MFDKKNKKFVMKRCAVGTRQTENRKRDDKTPKIDKKFGTAQERQSFKVN